MRAIVGWMSALMLAATPAVAQPADADYWATLETWVGAIENHEPGSRDEALLALASMPDDQFEGTLRYMTYLLDNAHEGRGTRAFDELFRRLSGDITLSPEDAHRLEALVARVSGPGMVPFLKRAAMLHTDTALFYPEGQLTTSEGLGHIAADGETRGDLGRPWHWMLARSFLHLALTDWSNPRNPRLVPDSDPDVRLWYQAVANYLWTQRDYTEALPHVERGLQLFPADAELLFVRGLTHEVQAGAQIQAAVRDQVRRFTRPGGPVYVSSVKSARQEREQAETSFRRALASDPDHLEARLHLAHVLIGGEKFEDAIRELVAVLGRARTDWHRYFALMFMGRAYENVGRLDDARQSFEAAGALYPEASAPRLSISQLDLRAGDRAAAIRVLDHLARGRDLDADPLWRYDAVRLPGAALAWIDRARAAFGAVPR